MRELVPVKVKIGLRQNGHAKYPNFNILPCVMTAGRDWSQYVDTEGLGWHYDKTSGHKEETPDSPWGMQWGVLIVPEEFANEALARFPDECTVLTEAELEDFYDNKAHAHEPDEDIDNEVLNAIQLKRALGLPLTPQQQRAIDPEDDTRGIRKNKKRLWKDYKKNVNVKIKQRQ